MFFFSRSLPYEEMVAFRDLAMVLMHAIFAMAAFAMVGDLVELAFFRSRFVVSVKQIMRYSIPLLYIGFCGYAAIFPQVLLIRPYNKDFQETERLAQTPQRVLNSSAIPEKMHDSSIPEYAWGTKAIRIGELMAVKLSTTVTWLPNIVPPPGERQVFLEEGRWYFGLTHMLGGYNAKSNEYDLFRLNTPVSELSFRPTIKDIARINSDILVASHPDKLFTFNIGVNRFTSQLFVGYKNMGTLVLDIFSGDIWMPTYKHLDYYQVSSGTWINLDYVYHKFGASQILPDKDFVFITVSGRDTGGILTFNKLTREWKFFSDELFRGQPSSPKNIYFEFIAVSDRFVFAGGFRDNGFNKYLYVFDRSKESWSSYSKDSLPQAINFIV